VRLGGLLKTSFSDFPGRIAAVVYTRGCDLRCPFCHNPDLVSGAGPVLPIDEVMAFLRKRQGQLDGVVVTGGEPLLQEDLADFLGQVRALGFETKLDTNGTRPGVLAGLLDAGLVDYLAMDVKAQPARYADVTGVAVAAERIERSIRYALDSGVPHEFRTTVVQPLVGAADIHAIGELIAGCERYALQPFVPGRTLDPGFAGEPRPRTEMDELCDDLLSRGIPCVVRPSPAGS
jgi:pyruvate formate lyase activating enzyme